MTQWLQDGANIATMVGAILIPVGIGSLYWQWRKDSRDARQQTYLTMAREYREYLKLCLSCPELPGYDYLPYATAPASLGEKRTMMLFEILVSMMEPAYLLYRGDKSREMQGQWDGWKRYAGEWFDRAEFREAWRGHLGTQFDQRFIEVMEELLSAHVSGGAKGSAVP